MYRHKRSKQCRDNNTKNKQEQIEAITYIVELMYYLVMCPMRILVTIVGIIVWIGAMIADIINGVMMLI